MAVQTTSAPVEHAPVEQALPWQKIVARYARSDDRRSWLQVLTSVVPYVLLLAVMFLSLRVSYWLTLLLAVPAAGFMIRTFIIFHDCGHGSFFRSPRLNDAMGILTGILAFTPYYRWRRDHAIHHATVGDLDRRGVGDVMTLTVKEYQALSPWRKFVYRVSRNPWMIFTVGSLLVFTVGHRFPTSTSGTRERNNVYATNLVLLAVLLALSAGFGLAGYVMVFLPVLFLATGTGVWLFYVQHQFEGVYWERHERWNFLDAALKGSSFYKLPRVLQWFTGNIGFHHIHHVNPRIPNYNLEPCHNAHPLFRSVQPLTLRASARSLRLNVYDEERRKLVAFRDLK